MFNGRPQNGPVYHATLSESIQKSSNLNWISQIPVSPPLTDGCSTQALYPFGPIGPFGPRTHTYVSENIVLYMCCILIAGVVAPEQE